VNHLRSAWAWHWLGQGMPRASQDMIEVSHGRAAACGVCNCTVVTLVTPGPEDGPGLPKLKSRSPHYFSSIDAEPRARDKKKGRWIAPPAPVLLHGTSRRAAWLRRGR